MAENIPDLAKDKSRSRIDGGVFEFQLAGLVAARLRALARRRPRLRLRFQLATNVQGANPFDDIVLHLRWCPEGAHLPDRQLTYFMQLKHKENVNVIVTANDLAGQISARNNDFKLRHYLSKFNEAVEKVVNMPEEKLNNTMETLRQWFEGDYRLVLLTTRQVLPKSWRASSSVDFPFEEVFSTGQGEAFCFGETDAQIWHMLRGRPPEEVAAFRERFLRWLRVVSGQAHVSALDGLLGAALADALGGPPPRAEALLAGYSAFLRVWWDASDAWNLSENSSEIDDLVGRDLNAQSKRLCFKPDFCRALSERFCGWRIAYVVVKDVDAEWRCSALAHTLDELSERYVIVTDSTFAEYPVSALESVIANRDVCSVLLFSIDSLDNKMRTFISKILNDETCKLIVVSSKWNETIHKYLSSGERNVETWSEHWALEDLSENQSKLLQRTVLFQGYEKQLKELQWAWPTLRRGIRGVSLNALLGEETVVLNFPVPTLDSLHLPQTLLYNGPSRTVLGSSLWTDCMNTERFILRGFPASELRILRSEQPLWDECDYTWTSKSKRYVTELVDGAAASGVKKNKTQWVVWEDVPHQGECNSKKNLHLITWEGGGIIHQCLKCVTPYEMILQPHVIEGHLGQSGNEEIGQFTLENLINRCGVTCLTSEPGMGKSSFISRMADILKREYPSELVIVVRISQDSLMQDTPEDVLLKDIVDLFIRVVHWESPASQEMMRHLIGSCLKDSGCVSILIDGFDEVCPAHKGKALSVLRVLARQAKFRRLWVTTRPVVEEDLTGALDCAPFRLRHFSEDDQREYLLRRWGDGQMATAEDGEHLKQRVDRFLTTVRAATAHDGRTMCEVPLYMRILADTFRDDNLHSDASDGAESEHDLSTLKIVQKFVDDTRKRYWTKSDVPFDKITNQGWHSSSESSFLQQHKICGAFLIFEGRNLGDFFNTNIVKEVKQYTHLLETERTGIIMKVSNGSPVFIHRIFAEYFAGLWLKEHYEQVPSLMEGVLRGELEEVRYFLDGLLAEGRALHEAALDGRYIALEAALRAGAAVDEADAGGRTALHLAAAHAHRDAARALLLAGASVHARDRVRGWTALQYANALLRLRKPRFQRPDEDECPPHLRVVDELLGHGADPRHAQRALKSKKALFFALANDCARVTEAWLGSAIRKMLHFVPTDYMHVAAEHDSSNVIDVLIRLGFDMNSSSTDEEGRTPLHIAAEKNYTSVCKILLQNGAQTKKQDVYGNTPLHIAAEMGNNAVCSLLIMHKANPDPQTHKGVTPLMMAAAFGHEEVCRVLLDGKARMDIEDLDGNAAIKYADVNGHHKVCHLFLERGMEYVHRRGLNGATPLHWAAWRGYERVCRVYLHHGAHVDARDSRGNTPLHLAARRGLEVVCEKLLERGASVDERDAQGNSALHLAARRGHALVCEVLVIHGANIWARNSWDESVYNLADDEDVLWVLDNSPFWDGYEIETTRL